MLETGLKRQEPLIFSKFRPPNLDAELLPMAVGVRQQSEKTIFRTVGPALRVEYPFVTCRANRWQECFAK